MQGNRFWMVWNPQGQAPTKRHESHESALNEARRLAQWHPEETFFVLVAEKVVSYDPLPFREWGLY